MDFQSGGKWAFRTAEQDAQGHANRYTYALAGDIVRLTSVVDADGHVSTVNYYSANTNLIHSIVDPFNRSAAFIHNAGGCLTGVIDVGGLTNAVFYDHKGWITNLTTPYGVTAFTYFGGVDGSAPADNRVNRAVIITEPHGGRQMRLFRGLSSQLNTNPASPVLIPDAFPANEVPANTPLGTLDTTGLNYRNSFHWRSDQFALWSPNSVVALIGNELRYFRSSYSITSIAHV